jgi:C-terminal processing protease CtpA/Prc
MKAPFAGAIVLATTCFVSSAQRASPPPYAPQITKTFVHGTVLSLKNLIGKQYFDATAIPYIQGSLVTAEEQGDYKVSNLKELAAKLNETLSEASHDKHLFVHISEHQGAAVTHSLPRAESARDANFGLKRAEILDGNVGYLEITAFYRKNEGAKTLQAAMNFVSHTDALILDLRNNRGGSPDTAIQLLSYFFMKSDFPLFSVIPRYGNPIVYRTKSQGVSYRDQTRPLYVLVSGSTWSAGEAVPFILQEQHRATIIGEKTAGAANPGGPWPINNLLSVTIPSGHIESEVRKTNWEGQGVIPDINVPASQALRVAYAEALGKLLNTATSTAERDTLYRALATAKNR